MEIPNSNETNEALFTFLHLRTEIITPCLYWNEILSVMQSIYTPLSRQSSHIKESRITKTERIQNNNDLLLHSTKECRCIFISRELLTL